MVNAVLHVICGNCGNGDPDMMEVRTYPGDGIDPTCAAVSCKNCTTLHFLDGDKFRHQDHRQTDTLRARVAELEAERAELVHEVGAALHHFRAEIDLGHPLATLATMHRQAIDAAREGE